MKRITQAVILAGGQGIRMRPFTNTLPKPMIPINGKPFLQFIVEDLKKNNIKKIVILTGYQHKKIENYFKDGKAFGLRIIYSYSKIKTGTGTRIKNSFSLLHSHFLLLYGDNFWPLNKDELIKYYNRQKKIASVVVYKNIDKYTKNNMNVNEKGVVDRYEKISNLAKLNGVDVGYFILDKKIFRKTPEENFSFEDVIIKNLVKKKQLSGYLTQHKYYGLSNPSRITLIEKFFQKRKIVFLDRDGVINQKPPKAEYVENWEDFIVLEKVKEALRLLKKKGYEIYIISNQPGIARGMVTREQIDKLNQNFIDKAKTWGVTIDGVYVCPHGWNEGCWCRKPKPGLFFQASYDKAINLFESYCIGDDERDILAARAIHCKKSFLVTKKHNLYSIVKKNL